MNALDQLVSEVFADDSHSIAEDTPFAECEGWDSLKHVELIVAVETRFGVELTASEVERLTCKRAGREILAARQLDA
jgi:acyl carrier protein